MATNNRPHMVVNDDRTITVPEELKLLAMQYDHNMESVTFDCPRYWDDKDLSELDIYINYETPDGKPGSHKCTEVAVDTTDETMIHFVWTILAPVTMLPGNIMFLVCSQRMNEEYAVEKRWHTQPCTECKIMKGLSCRNEDTDNAVVVPDNYNIDSKLAELKTEIENVKGMFLNYDSNGNFIVDNAESVNGIVLGKDENGVFIES